jgi:hypothetical protein
MSVEIQEVANATILLQRPRAIAQVVLEQPLQDKLTPVTMPKLSEEAAGELLVTMVVGLAEENTNFANLLAAQQAKESAVRSVDAIDVLAKAYELTKDHWGEFMFLITYLDRKGTFNKLKKKKAWSDFFGVLLEEE